MAITDEQRRPLNAAMDKYADGDEAAFGEFYDRLSPSLMRYFRSKVQDQACAEDLVQQTLLQLHAARRNYNRGSDVQAWAFAIGKNLMTDGFRKTRKEILSLDADDFQASIDRTLDRASMPDVLAVTKEMIEEARTILEQLSPEQRESYDLVKTHDLSIAQAAEVQGISQNAVKLRIHRVYEALRNIFKADDEQ